MMPGLQAGLSALQAAQVGMDTVAQNLANATTPEYHRQVVGLRDRLPVWRGSLAQGTGVDVEQIRRLQDAVVDLQRLRGTGELASNGAQLEIARKVEDILGGGSHDLRTGLSQLFDRLVELSGRADDPNARRAVIQAAADLSGEFHRVVRELDLLRSGIDQQLQSAVDQANSLAVEISKLNKQIRGARVRGLEPNDLLDRRDQLLQQLAGLTDVRLNEAEDVVVAANGQWMIGIQTPPRLELAVQSEQAALRLQGHTATFLPAGGRLAGLLAARSDAIPAYRQRIDDLVGVVIKQLDGAYASAIKPGTEGFQSVTGTRPVRSADVPLAELATVPPIQAGTLSLGITNLSTGQRTLTRIEVDPATDSLEDVAASLSSIDHLQAFVSPQGKALQIMAESGYQFDFTGRPSTRPDLTLVAGTTLPTVSGLVDDFSAGELFFVATGSGEIGVTPGLQVQVVDASGNQRAMLDVGQGYAADTPIDLDNGLQIAFSAGTLVVSDSVSVTLVEDADTSDLLAAMGIQSLFTGQDADTFQVSPALAADFNQLATSLTGWLADTGGLQRLLNQRDTIVAEFGQTMEDLAASVVTGPGHLVRQLADHQEQLEAVQSHLDSRRDAVSGVDANEELANMLQFQRQFQAGAQVLRVVHEATSELMTLIR